MTFDGALFVGDEKWLLVGGWWLVVLTVKL